MIGRWMAVVAVTVMLAPPAPAQLAESVDDVVELPAGGGEVVIDPTANDLRAVRDGVPAEWTYAQHVSNPEHGRVLVDVGNPLLLRYIPGTAMPMSDAFDYHAQDTLGSLIRGTVRLVAPGADEPDEPDEPDVNGEVVESDCLHLFVLKSLDLVLETPCTPVRLRGQEVRP